MTIGRLVCHFVFDLLKDKEAEASMRNEAEKCENKMVCKSQNTANFVVS